MGVDNQPGALETAAAQAQLTPALALGLGAGVYFEYFRRPSGSPTHWIGGLRPGWRTTLDARLVQFRRAPTNALRAALRENALWFNLDRAPTTALLGLEMFAEELDHFNLYGDWVACLRDIGAAISTQDALFRRRYCGFLNEITYCLNWAAAAEQELAAIADEWDALAQWLLDTANAGEASSLERASRLTRRLAFREEHFWGSILDTVQAAR